MSPKSPPNVVLVGAGAGGFLLFRRLSEILANINFHLNLVVIEPRRFYVHRPSTIRMVVTPEGSFEKRSIMEHPLDLHSGSNTRFVFAKVTSIVDKEGHGGHFILDNGDTIVSLSSFWLREVVSLVLLRFSDTKESVSSWRKRFKEAQDIVIVGGEGCWFRAELSGEIKDQWLDKRVTVVHSQALPLNDAYPDRWRKKVALKVQKRNVTLVFNDCVTNLEPENGNIVTRGGKTIPADLVVPAFGPQPNTEFIKSLGADVLTEQGFVKILPTFQLVHHPRIFALGDIIDWKEQKQLHRALGHAEIVANNVMSLVRAGNESLKSYKGTPEIIAVINGKNGGSAYVGILWGIILGDWITSNLKGKTLVVDLTKKTLGL